MTEKKFHACIFDIDNVIIDTRYSYTDCIRQTVQQYLVAQLNYRPSKSLLLSQHDVEFFKLLGGFNDDWDTCYGLLLYFLSIHSESKSITDLKSKKNLGGLLKTVTSPLGVNGIEKLFGKSNDVSLKIIVRMFQKLYWSQFIKEEKPILPPIVFKKLQSRGIQLGIATGRNLKEARYVLKRYGILKYIDTMITIDRLPHPRFKKPNPYSLIQIIKQFGPALHFVYIGDLPDDVRMAKLISGKYKVEGWGFNFLSSSKHVTRKALLKAGATRVISSSKTLIRVLSEI